MREPWWIKTCVGIVHDVRPATAFSAGNLSLPFNDFHWSKIITLQIKLKPAVVCSWRRKVYARVSPWTVHQRRLWREEYLLVGANSHIHKKQRAFGIALNYCSSNEYKRKSLYSRYLSKHLPIQVRLVHAQPELPIPLHDKIYHLCHLRMTTRLIPFKQTIKIDTMRCIGHCMNCGHFLQFLNTFFKRMSHRWLHIRRLWCMI